MWPPCLGFGLCDNFHLGGILKLSDLDSVTIFIGGVFWNSRIWTVTIFIWGGYSETLRFGLCDNFHFLGGILNFRIGGILSEFGPKFQPFQQAHASQIVSHILRMWRLISSSSLSVETEPGTKCGGRDSHINLSAEKSLCLIVETELRTKWWCGGDQCTNV